ncbi:hypothetical protein JOB18_004247 [Solea senegalensis]|uniref:Uncharacterized protein n=1 Tax=Solea senegalensis TaxID=28829 RepID=A0AAV6QVI8_SOLSE|nr:hypothetical protein JOB18_004247 [Solea senegalensis]
MMVEKRREGSQDVGSYVQGRFQRDSDCSPWLRKAQEPEHNSSLTLSSVTADIRIRSGLKCLTGEWMDIHGRGHQCHHEDKTGHGPSHCPSTARINIADEFGVFPLASSHHLIIPLAGFGMLGQTVRLMNAWKFITLRLGEVRRESFCHRRLLNQFTGRELRA